MMFNSRIAAVARAAQADHFLVVTGIDTNKEIVHLNDPASSSPTSRCPSPPSRTPGRPARNRSSSPAERVDH